MRWCESWVVREPANESYVRGDTAPALPLTRRRTLTRGSSCRATPCRHEHQTVQPSGLRSTPHLLGQRRDDGESKPRVPSIGVSLRVETRPAVVHRRSKPARSSLASSISIGSPADRPACRIELETSSETSSASFSRAGSSRGRLTTARRASAGAPSPARMLRLTPNRRLGERVELRLRRKLGRADRADSGSRVPRDAVAQRAARGASVVRHMACLLVRPVPRRSAERP